MAAGDPTGGDLASGSFDGSTLTTSWAEKEITLDAPYALTAGTKYAVVLRAPSADGGAPINWTITTPSVLANGSEYYSNDSGSSWVESSFAGGTYDGWFKTKATGVEKDSATFASTASFEDVSGTYWVAQTFTASSSYSITSIVLKLKKSVFPTAPGTVTVSIRATEAAFSPPVGRATQKRLVAAAASTFYYEDI